MTQLNSNKQNNTFNLAFSGICLALCVVLLILSSFPIGIDKLLVLAAGFLVFLVTKNIGFKWGVLFYVAATLLSLLIVPAKIELMVFIIAFGPFSIIFSLLYKTEKINKVVKAIIAIVLMTALISLTAFLFAEIFVSGTDITVLGKEIKLALPVFVLGFGVFSGIICYIVYYPLSEIIMSRLGKRNKGEKKKNNDNPTIIVPKLYEEDEDDPTLD